MLDHFVYNLNFSSFQPTKIFLPQGATLVELEFVSQDWAMPTFSFIALYAVKPDGTRYYINGTQDAEANSVRFRPTAQLTLVPGTVMTQLQLIVQGSGEQKSFPIELVIVPSVVTDGAIESTDEMTAIEQILEDLGDLSDMNTRLQAVEEEIDPLDIAHGGTGATTEATARANLGLGTSFGAFYNGQNDTVQAIMAYKRGQREGGTKFDDLNAFTETGIYITSQAYANVPVASPAFLLVFASGTTLCLQVFVPITANEVYIRKYNNTIWDAWRSVTFS